MENRTALRLFGVGAGVTLALVLSTTKPSFKLIALSSLISIPPIIVGLDITQSTADKRVAEANKKVRDAEEKLANCERRLVDCERVIEAKYQLEQQLKVAQQQVNKLETNLAGLYQQRNVERELTDFLKVEKSELTEKLNQLQQEYDYLSSNFDNQLAFLVDERVTEYKENDREAIIEKLRTVNDYGIVVNDKAEVIVDKCQELAKGLMYRANKQREIYDRTAQQMVVAASKWDTERQAYLEQIELLTEKIGRLQQRLTGDLVEPVYLKCGFSPSGRIANALAEWLWNHQQIPLKVTGVESGTDSILTAGYSYSRSMPVEELTKVIEDNSPTIARSLGLYAIEKPHKLPIADVLTLKIRRERPAKKTSNGALYRNQQEFIKYILSQPIRFRLIGEPGAGKTPTVAVMLAHLLLRGFLEANTPNGRKLPHTIVEFCNPLAGISVKNSTDLDFCLKWDNGYKGFKGLADEYRFRKNKSNTNYLNQVGYIWVADEIDNTMAELTKDEAKPFKNSLKDGGHINIGVIVMGQSANVSTSKGLSIDDQKMMTNIYIDPVSIRTFLTQYGERFYSKKTVEKALSTLEEIELEIEEQNEVICDTARELRIGMVTAQRSPVFYQLPYFDSTNVDVNDYQQNLEKMIAIRSGRGETGCDGRVLVDFPNPDTARVSFETDTSGRSPYVESETATDVSHRPNCSHCGSDRIRSKGNKWLCQNPEHSTIAPGKPKSWKK